MEIIRCTRGSVVKEIGRLKRRLSASPDKLRALAALEKAEKTFRELVDDGGVAIKCTAEELTTLASEYIRMLAKKHHLAICAFVEKGVSVYSVRQIERLKESAVYSVTLPYNSADDKIALFIYYYDAYEGEVYDIDLISKRFCS